MEFSLHTLYYSNNCRYCRKVLAIMKELPALIKTVNMIDVLKENHPDNVNVVPCLMMDNSTLIQGRQVFEWLEREKKKTVEAYEFGFGNASFSFIGSNGHAENIRNYTELSNQEKQGQQGHSSSGDSMIDRMIEERNKDVPQFIKRV